MKNSKTRKKQNKRSFRIIIMIAALVLILGTAAGFTVAYLTANSGKVTNKFTPAKVSCAVDEDFEDPYTLKENVRIQNTGDVDAYIRATVVVNWVKADGTVCAGNHIVSSSSGNAYEIDYNDGEGSKWTLEEDGYWYYSESVAPNGYTDNLINAASTQVAQPDGCTLQIQVIASAIQADGITDDPADAWGVDPTANNSGN